MAEPTCTWVTIPSQISFISSFGCDVMTSDPDFPLIVTGTLTAVRSGCTSATNHAGGPFDPSSAPERLADMAIASTAWFVRVILT